MTAVIFSNVAGFRSSIYSKVAKLLLVYFLKMNLFRRSEDHIPIFRINSLS